MTHSIQRALLSVSDKTGIVEFAKKLRSLNIELISTGGTAKLLRDNHLPVIDVSDYTGFPEIMGGRVKTLHPKIHGAILGRSKQDSELMTKHGIKPIDLVVVNLYPFEQTISKPDIDLITAIENIDIGGPTMLRAAAKNHERVTVVCNASDYSTVFDEIQNEGGHTKLDTRFDLACKAFEHTAQYDTIIANYLNKQRSPDSTEKFPEKISFEFTKKQDLRYGENPHQMAAFYQEKNIIENCIATATQIQGKPLSYNNIADSDAALECVRTFSQCACVIVKHANPCGVASSDSIFTAYERAFATDPTSAFGGIIAFNKPLDAKTASAIIERQFVEVIIAPLIPQDVRAILSKKQNVRVLETGVLKSTSLAAHAIKRVTGGVLVQDKDIDLYNESDWRVVSKTKPTEQQVEDLKFAWTVAKFVKSNAIVYASDNRTIGIGAGQMSRVYSAKLAAIKAQDEGLEVNGSVMASDAFFPFRDAIDAARDAGITAIIQPGGSIRDQEIIDAADEAGIAMVFTGMRHFNH